MEMQLQPHYWTRRAPDWTAAVVAGIGAGAVLMVLELLWAATLGDIGPWRISRMVAALVMGPGVLGSSDFSLGLVTLALITHYAMGIASGLVIGVVIAGFHYESSLGMMLVIGAAFGAVIYMVNFHAVSWIFPWFSELRGWGTLIGHLVFGMAAALIYWTLSRRSADR